MRKRGRNTRPSRITRKAPRGPSASPSGEGGRRRDAEGAGPLGCRPAGSGAHGQPRSSVLPAPGPACSCFTVLPVGPVHADGLPAARGQGLRGGRRRGPGSPQTAAAPRGNQPHQQDPGQRPAGAGLAYVRSGALPPQAWSRRPLLRPSGEGHPQGRQTRRLADRGHREGREGDARTVGPVSGQELTDDASHCIRQVSSWKFQRN